MLKYHPAVEFMKRHAYLLLGGLCLFVIGIIYIVGRGGSAEVVRTGDMIFDSDEDYYYVSSEDMSEYDPDDEDIEPPEPTYIVVHVTGAVNSPRNVILRAGARVGEAIDQALGMRHDADEIRINTAVVLEDAMQIIVPAVGQEIDNVFVFDEGMGGISSEPTDIVVHVTGAVNSPGNVTLSDGSRVLDAIKLAGGTRDDADETRINMAAFLRDAMQIIVPYTGQEIDNVFVFSGGQNAGNAQGSTQNQSGGTSSGLININTATAAELQTLSGVGPAVAQRIIDFREAHGYFSSVEELTLVSGIGDATLERLRPHITVD